MQVAGILLLLVPIYEFWGMPYKARELAKRSYIKNSTGFEENVYTISKDEFKVSSRLYSLKYKPRICGWVADAPGGLVFFNKNGYYFMFLPQSIMEPDARDRILGILDSAHIRIA